MLLHYIIKSKPLDMASLDTLRQRLLSAAHVLYGHLLVAHVVVLLGICCP